MGVLGRLRGLLGRETRSQPYTDAVVRILQGEAGGSASVDGTAALETAAGAYGRAFASAKVSPSGPRTGWLTPHLLNVLARNIIVRGEWVARLRVEAGQVAADVPATWHVTGGHRRSTWTYQVTSHGPSSTHTEYVPEPGIVHVQYAHDLHRPWLGLGPLHVAVAEGKLHAATVEALADEAAGPRGSLLPIPTDGEDENLDEFKATIGTLRGKMAVVETTAAGWSEGRMAAPREDYGQKRIGANPPDSLRNLRTDSARAILAATGVPVELVALADGTGQREAYRRFLFGSVLPLARIVERELAAKLETEVRLDFSELMASDLAGRARAFQSMVGGGMELERAAALAGLMTPEAA